MATLSKTDPPLNNVLPKEPHQVVEGVLCLQKVWLHFPYWGRPLMWVIGYKDSLFWGIQIEDLRSWGPEVIENGSCLNVDSEPFSCAHSLLPLYLGLYYSRAFPEYLKYLTVLWYRTAFTLDVLSINGFCKKLSNLNSLCKPGQIDIGALSLGMCFLLKYRRCMYFTTSSGEDKYIYCRETESAPCRYWIQNHLAITKVISQAVVRYNNMNR